MIDRLTRLPHTLARRLNLPQTATAPFCPSEVQGVIAVPDGLSRLKRLMLYAGPGLLVAVGYMDPGNWATDIAAGARFGYDLLFVILLSGLAGILLQMLAARLGIVAGRDLAQACSAHYPRPVALGLWLMAELAIIATDVAEVLGAALAIKLLFGLSLWLGILLTGLDLVIVLGLKGKGFRQVEAIILALVSTIGLCFVIELFLAHPDGTAIMAGLVPDLGRLRDPDALYLAIGIIGATVMPHNLYLHSSIVQTRQVAPGEDGVRRALRMASLDTVVSLAIAIFINAAILILAAATFHLHGRNDIADIADAKALLAPLTGAAAAGLIFAIALFASGQSSTFTGTITGQVILEGFLDLKIPCWQRRAITRILALIPALGGVLWLGDGGIGRLLVLTQVVLSLQLPFAIWPLIRLTRNRGLMKTHRAPLWMALAAWGIFAAVVGANLWLILHMMEG
ncbi:Nramp family divalent metal transporter [Asticcacaulis sp. EMRT-3]|uniref:Nramp family divalent metal transporter n=1 Tax=Asticcacaulis sp. EMRT-3 TaxID=3040349 RepID=UPI0024AFA16F|nr:Nramp family divalent metal transporter [Asticcacaulis sp. EMRT-3]MDI7775251.1 Nramp family divalent metal transporter [Asticcacaulis sp. EMRT-3]